jgi:hypothetical protein
MTHPDRPAAVWSLSWRHPDALDDSVEWGIRVRIGYESSEAWVSLRVAVQPVSTVLRPVRVDIGRPGLVPRLLDDPGARADGRRLAATPQAVGDATISALEELLTREDRRLPVVVTTPWEADGRPSVDPHRIADRLAGVAHVVNITTPSATFGLTNAVGKERSVFLGAVRLYWPGFSVGANPREHPLWLPRTIDEWAERGRDFVSTVFAKVQRQATFRLAVPPLQNEIEKAINRQRANELATLRARLSEASGIPDDWFEDFESTLDRAAEAEDHIEELQAELQRTRETLEASQANVIELSRLLGRGTPDDMALLEPEAPTAEEPRTVLEAVELASAAADHVVYLDSAFDGARDSDYRQPDRILDGLRALSLVARRYAEDDLPAGFGPAFQELGYQYASDISYTDRHRYGGDYERTYNGRTVQLGPHLKFGIGSSDTCARIYWYIDEGSRQLVVGHVGKHLRTTDS